MSSLLPELVLIRRGFRDRIARFKRIVARATPWPFGVRLGVFLGALAAESLAYPPQFAGGVPVVVLVALATLPALWPRTAAVSVFYLFTVVGWLVSTTLYNTVATLPRLVGLAAMLYLVHSGAALAAVLPYDAVVDPAVVARWLLRAFAVVLLAAALTIGAAYVVGRFGPRTYFAATLVGLALTVAVAWLLAATARRR